MKENKPDAFLKRANRVVEENKKLRAEKQELKDQCKLLNKTIKQLELEVDVLSSERPMYLEIRRPKEKVRTLLGLCHHSLADVLKALSCGLNVYLYGPSGSGKTYAANQCAQALGVPLYFTGAISNEYKLTGYMDVKGEYVSTEFRKAYEQGGLFLFDELDGSFPQAVLAFNAALANDYMDFPDKQVKRNEKFYCIAAANTVGQGANRQYVGRNQLDAASLDRFVFVEWDYDEKLERKVAGNNEWVDYVLKVRKAVQHNGMRHIVSPRASIYGAKLLKNGFERNIVENMVLWRGLDSASVESIKSLLEPIVVKSNRNGNVTFNSNNRSYGKVALKTGDKVMKGDTIAFLESSYYGDTNRIQSPVDGIISYTVKEGQWVSENTDIATICQI